jgi:hypothetical protein
VRLKPPRQADPAKPLDAAEQAQPAALLNADEEV